MIGIDLNGRGRWILSIGALHVGPDAGRSRGVPLFSRKHHAIEMSRILLAALLLGAAVPSIAVAQVHWAQSAGGVGHDDARGVGVDSAGNAYIVGDFSGEAWFGPDRLTAIGATNEWGEPPGNFHLAKVDPQGDWVWAIPIEADGVVEGLAVTPAGEAYVAARFRGVARLGPEVFESEGTGFDQEDGFLAKYDAGGRILWARHLRGVGDFDAEHVALDSLGSVFLLGTFSGELQAGDVLLESQGVRDAVLMKCTPAGGFEWARSLGGAGSDSSGKALAVGTDGSIWVLGDFSGRIRLGSDELVGTGPGDDFLAKLSPAGAVLWARRMEGRMGGEPEEELATDPVGGCYLVGNFAGEFGIGEETLTSTDEQDDVFVVRFDPDGNVLWAKRLGGASTDYCDALAVGADGGVTIAGAGGDPDTGENPPHAFLHALSPEGMPVSSLVVRTDHPEGDISILALARSADGTLFAAGWLEGRLDVAGGARVSAGDRDVFLMGATIGGRPRLNVQLAESKVRLSWPAAFGGYVLQTRSDLKASSSWRDVAEVPTVVGDDYTVEMVPDESVHLFRLVSQE